MLATKVSVDCKIPIDNVKSRFIEMFQNSNYSCVHLSDVLNQYYVPEKIDKPELESYITLSSYGKGIKKREIKEGKTPVPFTGCRIKAGQFISSRLHAKEGAFGLVPEELDGFVVSRDFPVFDIDINQINPKYLLAAVSHESFYQQFLNDSFGSTTKRRIKENIFLEYSIVLPPLDKQNEYVSFLEHIGHIRTMLKRYLYLLDSLVKSRFIEMFGSPDNNRYDLPVETLNQLTMGKLTYGIAASAIDYDGKTRYIRITDIDEDGNLNDDYKSPDEYDEKYLLNDGDILFARSGATVGKTFQYSSKYGQALYAGYLIRSIPDVNKILPKYLLYATKSAYYNKCIEKLRRGATQPNINAQQYGSLEFLVPPLDQQESFVNFVQQVDKSKFSDGMICSR